MPECMNFSKKVLPGTYPNIGSSVAPPLVGVTQKGSIRGQSRLILSKAWNGKYASQSVVNHALAVPTQVKPSTTPFRAVMNAGDYLSREHYSCGGPNMIGSGPPGSLVLTSKDGGQSNRQCDSTQIPPSTCNVKYVYDGSDYIRFRKEQAKNRNRKDYTYGGSNNGAYTALEHVRH